jgi:hypothetical protein
LCAALKKRIRAGDMSLAALVPVCVEFEEELLFKDNVKAVQSMWRLAARHMSGTSPLLNDLKDRLLLTERAYGFCEGQLSRVLSYSSTRLTSSEATFFLCGWPWPRGASGSSAPASAPAGAPAETPAEAPAEAPAAAQGHRLGAYVASPDPLPPDSLVLFACKYNGGSSSASAMLDDITPAETLAADHCMPCDLEDTHVTHICCPLWCTCLVFIHWGLPCAHMFRAMTMLNICRVPNGVVHRRWLPEDDAERDKAVARLRTVAIRSGDFMHQLPRDVLNADERFTNLCNIGNALADLGSVSEQLYRTIMAKMVNIHSQARVGTLLPKSKGARQQVAAARVALAADRRAAGGGASMSGAPGAAPVEEEEEEEELVVLNRTGGSDMGKRKRSVANKAKEAGAKMAKKEKAKAAAQK